MESVEQLDTLAEQALKERDYQQAQVYAWQQLDIDKLRETAVYQLMTALAKTGQRSAAMAQYEIYKRRLGEAAGDEPSAELTELYQRIQADELELTQLRLPAQPPPDGTFNPIFCYTDIENSTRLWDEHREAMLIALRQHNDLIEYEIARFDGRILHPTGDGFLIVFEQNDPLQFGISLQERFSQADWGEIGQLRIRIGFHGATADQEGHEYFREDDGWYRGSVLNHAARIADTGHGGQIVASDMVKAYCPLPPGAEWQDLGEHGLKSLDDKQHIYGLIHPDLTRQSFPPLRTPANKKAASKEEDGRVRGYELGQIIGQGAFGEVYRAVQPGVGRAVAVKIIRSLYANQPEFIRRFEAEAQVIARLEHPYIVPLYDYWREADGAFLVMRYMGGGSLKTLLDAGEMPLDSALSIIDQIGTALTYAHQQGFVHRDIKPANILLDDNGSGYLSDFGIVKDMNLDGEGAEADAVIGTPAYLSPEQAMGQTVTPLSDQYSLAVTLYEMLTGRRAFGDASPATLITRQINDPLPLVVASRPEIPAGVDECIQRATAKDPSARFENIPAMIRALHVAARTDGSSYPMPAGILDLEQDLLNPYKGLRSFQEADAANFFGRSALIEQLLTRFTEPPMSENVPTDRFLAVVGPSGGGKSSVVLAGLLPALRRGAVPGSEKWYIVDMIPGTNPLEELAAAMLRIAVNPPDSLLDQLQEDEQGILRAVENLLPEDDIELLLVIDQFEELYTLVEDEVRRNFFINSLLNALNEPGSRMRVVVTLRADFYDRPLTTPGLAVLMRHCMEIVPLLTRSELEEVIVQPAIQVGAVFEAELVPEIIDDVSEQPGALPLLQYALTELFERRQERLLTRAAYNEIGGVLGALGRRAEELYAGLDEEGQEAARQLFMRLVTLGEGTEDTRRRVLRSEVLALGTSEVLEAYGRARLITFDRDPATREPTVEVAHEALLREWPRLRGWLDENRDDVRLQRRLAAATAEWGQSGQDEGYLLRGSRLDLFVGWVAGSSLALTQNEQTYLERSEEARHQRLAEEDTRRRKELETAQQLAATEHQRAEEQAAAANSLRLRALYLGAALVIAAVLAIVAVAAGRQATNNAAAAEENANLAATNEAQAVSNSELAATREAEAIANAELAAANEEEAVANANLALTREAEAEMQRNLAQDEAEQRAIAQAEAENEADISFSRELAAGTINNLESDPERSILLALEALAITRTLEAENALYEAIHNSAVRHTYVQDPGLGSIFIDYNPNGEQFFLSGPGGGAMWDVESGEIIYTKALEEGNWINGAAFTPDGRLLIMPVENWDGDTLIESPITIIEAQTGQELVSFLPGVGYTQYVTVLPDGRLFATVGHDDRVNIWDLEATLAEESGQLVSSLCCFEDIPSRAAFSPDSSQIVTNSRRDDLLVTVWDVGTGEQLYTLDSSNMLGVAYSPDGAYLVTGSRIEGWVEVWDAATQERLSTTKVHIGGQIRYLDFSPDGKMVASATTAGEVSLSHFDPGGLQPISRFAGGMNSVFDAEFTPDGRHLTTANFREGTARLWDVAVGGAAEQDAIVDPQNIITDLKVLADGRLATANNNGMLKVWDTVSGDLIIAIDAHDGFWVNEMALSPDGRQLVSAGEDGHAKVWDTTSWQLLHTLEGNKDGDELVSIMAVTFSPDGQQLAGGDELGTLIVWDTLSWDQLINRLDHETDLFFTTRTGPIHEIIYTADGRLAATTSLDGTVRIRDAANGEVLLVVRSDPPSQLWGMDLSPDGRMLVAGRRDGGVHMWRLPPDPWNAGEEDVELLYSFQSGMSLVYTASFNSDSSQFALAGAGDVTEIRDTEDGSLSVVLPQPGGGNCAYFSEDGKHLATCGEDGTVRFFAIDYDELLELAQSRVTRSLTDEECRQYLHLDACPMPEES